MEKRMKLTELVERTIQEMERLQYSARYLREHKRQCKQIMLFANGNWDGDFYAEELGAKFLKEQYDYPPKEISEPLSYRVNAAIRCVRRLGEYQQFGAFVKVRQPLLEKSWAKHDISLIESYVSAMQTRDNSEATKKMRTKHIKLFYDFLGFRNVESINEVTAQILSDYTLSLQGGSLVYAKHRLATLRNYLRFLHANGFCERDLSYAVPKVNAPRNMNVPALWSKEEIGKLLESVDRGSPAGKRDYAVLLLAIQLGIRVSDIANLQIDSLKWDRKEIEFCQHKTGKRVIYFMLNEIGWAIIDYIRYARPNVKSPYLFLTCLAPHTNLQSGSVGCILTRQMHRCGIVKKAGTVSGMHSLRHALARNLLEQNIPLPLLSDIMGHARMSSTTPYVKVDIEGLRECGLFLEGWWKND